MKCLYVVKAAKLYSCVYAVIVVLSCAVFLAILPTGFGVTHTIDTILHINVVWASISLIHFLIVSRRRLKPTVSRRRFKSVPCKTTLCTKRGKTNKKQTNFFFLEN